MKRREFAYLAPPSPLLQFGSLSERRRAPVHLHTCTPRPAAWAQAACVKELPFKVQLNVLARGLGRHLVAQNHLGAGQSSRRVVIQKILTVRWAH